MSLQQPSAELLIYRMMPITGRRLHYLDNQRLDIVLQQIV